MFRRFFETRRTADVECAHRQLCAWFANRLCGDDADSLADVDRATCGKVSAITFDTATTPGFTGKNRTNLDALDS